MKWIKYPVIVMMLIFFIAAAKIIYANYTLSQKQLDLPNNESVYEIDFWAGSQWNAELSDKETILKIMELLPDARATNLFNTLHKETKVSAPNYYVYIRYYNSGMEEECMYFGVINHKGKYYIEFVSDDYIWQIDDELYQLLFETTMKLRAGELN